MLWFLFALSAQGSEWCDSKDVAVQHTLQQLQELYKVKDCADLAGVAEKEDSLSLASKNITDPRPLKMFTGLKQLNLVANNISDVTFLSSFSELEWLDLSKNPIGMTDSTVEMPRIKILSCRQCGLKVLPFTGMKSLREASLRQNELESLEFVAESPKLRILIVEGNQLADAMPLYNQRSLKRVDLIMNPMLREGCPTEKPAVRALREACKRVFPQQLD